MLSLVNRKIILGLSGGIAAYKAAELCRLLVKAGAEVRVVMTEGAIAFITPLTLQALSGNRVHTSLLDVETEGAMGHIELARWADLVLVAPASANTLARLATGEAPDLLSTLSLATRAPVALAPAMNQAMWADERTARNIATLKSLGFHILGPASGEQACGDVGMGRLLEPEALLAAAAGFFETGVLAGLRVCITAGPTREAIDPVRYLSNHSSGKMGYALARAAADAGAKVTLVSGPVYLDPPAGVSLVKVNSARDMLAACEQVACDIFVGVAAVADFRPDTEADHKLKKTTGVNGMQLALVKNPDILATIANRPEAPFCVGFAAETRNILDYARDKLIAKKLALIFANHATDTFNRDEACVTAIWQDGQQAMASAAKSQLATRMVALISERYRAQRP